MDNLIAAGKARPFIIVMDNGGNIGGGRGGAPAANRGGAPGQPPAAGAAQGRGSAQVPGGPQRVVAE